MRDPLTVNYETPVTVEPTDEPTAPDWEDLTPEDQAEWREIQDVIDSVIYDGESLEEADAVGEFKEFLHPRGRGGKWIRKLDEPSRPGLRVVDIRRQRGDTVNIMHRGKPYRGKITYDTPTKFEVEFTDAGGVTRRKMVDWQKLDEWNPPHAVAPGGPGQKIKGEDWLDYRDKVRADPFKNIEPGDDAKPIFNALQQIDSGWTIVMSKNRDELPSGSLPEGVEAVQRFVPTRSNADEPPDSLVIYTRRRDVKGVEEWERPIDVVAVGHGSMVHDHMIATPEMREQEVNVWKADQEKLKAMRAKLEAESLKQEMALAETKERVRAAVTTGNVEALRTALGTDSAYAASNTLQSAGMQLRGEGKVQGDQRRDQYTLRGQHGETVTVSDPPVDSFREMEEGVDDALRPGYRLNDDQVNAAASTVLSRRGDEFPSKAPSNSPEAAEWRARRNAVARKLATQEYTWEGRIQTGQENYPNGLWAVIKGEDGNSYYLDWAGNLHMVSPGEETRRIIHAPRDDRRLKAQGIGIEIAPNPQGGKRDRLPYGQAPKNVNEMLVDALGRADELGRKYDTETNVTAIVHDIIPRDAAAVHEWNGTISIEKRYLDDAKDYLETRAYAAQHVPPLRVSDSDHLNFYNDLEILQHEINHGVGVGGGVEQRNYQGLGKNVEEGLTEETAHLEVADWLRSYGMTDVLEAVARHPDDYRVRGTYFDYRTQFKKLMDDAKLTDEERRERLRTMKFKMSGEQQYAEIIRLANIKNPRITDLGAALPSPGLARGHEFQPVVRPDLSDIHVERPKIKLPTGREIQTGDAVSIASPDWPWADKGVVMKVDDIPEMRKGSVLVSVANAPESLATGQLWIPLHQLS
jgi:hypothetical protein